MTTSRKPPQPPTPRLTRPLAQPKVPHAQRPLTTEIMQRIRKVIEDSNGALNCVTIAQDIDAHKNQVVEWISGFRAAPGSERFAELCRWLAQHDPLSLREVFEPRQIKTIGKIQRTKGNGRLSDDQVRAIRDCPDFPEVDETLGLLCRCSPDAIRHIRSGARRQNVS